MHSLPWGELLSLDEEIFGNYEDIKVGVKVLAPWYCDDDIVTIRHAEAVIVADPAGECVQPRVENKKQCGEQN